MRLLLAVCIGVLFSFSVLSQYSTGEEYRLDSLEKIITQQEIDPFLKMETSDHTRLKARRWKKIGRVITRKYGSERAAKTILFARIRWYADIKDWHAYGRAVLERVRLYGPYFKMFPDDPATLDWRLNALAWDLFEHSNDTAVLLKALHFSEESMKLDDRIDGQYEDTYANILYKLGRVDEAIRMEEKALAKVLRNFGDPAPGNMDVTYRLTLKKMKELKPTWE